MGEEKNGVQRERMVRQDHSHWHNGTTPLLRKELGSRKLDSQDRSDFEGPVATNVPPPTWYTAVKRWIDLVGAVLLLIPAAPIIGLAGLLVKLTSPGPMLYQQFRLGYGNRRFPIYKIRTMTHNCEHESGPRWATAFDTRITAVGRVLRRLHIDELPQLWNVLNGDMSLVGPRPERPEFLPLLHAKIPDYTERLAVQPGMTGLAQVQLPPDTDVEMVRRKVKYDLYYIRHLSFWLDVRILVSTAYYLVQVPFFRVPEWFRVPDKQAVETLAESVPSIPLKAPARQPDTLIAADTRIVAGASRE